MSCPFNQAALDKLKQFVDICKTNSDILYHPNLSFFKEYLESLGASIPAKMSTDAEPNIHTAAPPKPEKVSEPVSEEKTESEESDLELDKEGCVEPDELSDSQKMGDPSKEPTDEETDKADSLRVEALQAFGEQNYELAVSKFTEAIENNPLSALLFAKRGQTYLKLDKPNACIKDCTKALELNCDSAAAYKFRGRAYRLLGEWEKAAKDLRQACNIDFDDQSNDWLKEVTPNAQKIEKHQLKLERKKAEKEEKDKLERIRKAREAHAKAQEANAAEGDEGPEGLSGMGDFYKLLQDPEIMAAFQNPEVAAAFKDISTNPSNFAKYQSNPKIMALITKLSSKFAGAGAGFPSFPMGGFPGFGGGANFPGGFPGAPPQPPSGKPFDEDNLD